MRNLLPLLASAAILHGCNRYELFAYTGFEQETFSAKADILFVVDNSASMAEETEALAESFAGFAQLLSLDASQFPTEDLSDAVDFYANLASSDRGAVVNYQIGVTTTDVVRDSGKLLGSGIVTRFEEDPGARFNRNLLCQAACLDEQPSICGANWTPCVDGGNAVEEPLEAVFLSMCRSVPNPPQACFEEVIDPGVDGRYDTADDIEYAPTLQDRDRQSAEGFLRDDATFIPVIVTDEGDDSRRVFANGAIPYAYRNLFAQFDRRMIWSVIGPYRNPENNRFPCPSGAVDWGAIRFEHFVESTNGLYIPIGDDLNRTPDGLCRARNFDEALSDLGQLLLNLNRSFRLRSLPEDGTIAVYTSDGGVIKPADEQGISDAGVPIYGDGFSYDATTNTVLLHGDAIPDFGEEVTVYYLPQDGNPRSLPF